MWRRRVRRPWARPRDEGHTVGLLGQIPSLPRASLVRLTALLIDHLDEIDGDLDLEFNGDEMDGHNSEDEFMSHGGRGGAWGAPGCPIADPDRGIDDARYDPHASPGI